MIAQTTLLASAAGPESSWRAFSDSPGDVMCERELLAGELDLGEKESSSASLDSQIPMDLKMVVAILQAVERSIAETTTSVSKKERLRCCSVQPASANRDTTTRAAKRER